jgi:hypothetical protein
MAVHIQIRGDVAADWTSTNPTLAEREMGLETDTGKYKIGDGATAWTSLVYSFGSYFAIADLIADHSWCGDVSSESVNEDAGLFGLLYLNSAGYKMAKADADATLPCVALQLVAGTGTKKILKRGYARDDTWTWTVGQSLWVSTGTAGLITSTKPSTSGNRIQYIGEAISADVIHFNPCPVWVEVP